MGVLEDLFGFITSGSIGGIPPIVIMIIPLIVGLIVGFLIHKFLKIALIGLVIVAIAAYLGFFVIDTSALASLAETYGPIVVQYGTLLIGILPLGIGFFIGLIVGFIVSK
jgi:uncharacterized membrane protein (Fun14 family)